jgi:hypothetical protein
MVDEHRVPRRKAHQPVWSARSTVSSAAFSVLNSTALVIEAIAAFTEKRPPKFSDLRP